MHRSLLLLTLLSLPAHAETIFATLDGYCVSLMALDQSLDPAVCGDKFLNTIYAKRRVAFVFTLEDNPVEVSVVTFFGEQKDQLRDGHTTVQPIDTVNFVEHERTLHLDAIGACRFTIQMEGLPTVISCSADTARGRFAGDFVSPTTTVEIKRVP
jgi:hypothetical protein